MSRPYSRLLLCLAVTSVAMLPAQLGASPASNTIVADRGWIFNLPAYEETYQDGVTHHPVVTRVIYARDGVPWIAMGEGADFPDDTLWVAPLHFHARGSWHRHAPDNQTPAPIFRHPALVAPQNAGILASDFGAILEITPDHTVLRATLPASTQASQHVIRAMVYGPSNHLYVGGERDTNRPARGDFAWDWDGTRWHTLGARFDAPLSAMVCASDTALFAAGSFTKSGRTRLGRVARWNGRHWHPLGTGLDGTVFALALGSDGSLFAGGAFSTAGGTRTANIARWDGRTWHALGQGLNGTVTALATDDRGTLYAGGDFTASGAQSLAHVARWDGRQWQPMGSGLTHTKVPVQVRTMVRSPDGDIIIGGRFDAVDGRRWHNLAQWRPR